MLSHHWPAFRRVKTGFGPFVYQRESKAALQRDLAGSEFVDDVGKVSGLKRFLRCCRSRNTLCLIVRISSCILGKQRSDEVGVILHILGRTREPFLKGAVQQSIREEEEKNNRAKR